MLDLRLKGLKLFGRKPMPSWGADLTDIDFDNIKYFVRSTEKQATSWDELPDDIKNTYDKLGIPEAEKQRLVAGVAAQYDRWWRDQGLTANRGQLMIKEINPRPVFSYDEEHERFVVAPVRAMAETGVRQTYEVLVGSRRQRRFIADRQPSGPSAARRACTGCRPGSLGPSSGSRSVELREGDLVAVPRRLPEFGAPYQLPRLAPGGHHLESSVHGPAVSSPDLMWLLGCSSVTATCRTPARPTGAVRHPRNG